MTEFKVYGPFRIPIEDRPGARVILYDKFWDTKKILQKLRTKKGVYIFSIKPPRSSRHTPYYVGQATKSFEKEAFSLDKLVKYHNAFSQFEKGYPSLFLVVHPDTRRRVKEKHIKEMEDYLIEICSIVNPETENVHGTKAPNWSIAGVIRTSGKRSSSSSKTFAEMFRLDK